MPVDSSMHNLLISVTENNDQPAAPDYMEEVLRKTPDLHMAKVYQRCVQNRTSLVRMK